MYDHLPIHNGEYIPIAAIGLICGYVEGCEQVFTLIHPDLCPRHRHVDTGEIIDVIVVSKSTVSVL